MLCKLGEVQLELFGRESLKDSQGLLHLHTPFSVLLSFLVKHMFVFTHHLCSGGFGNLL